MLLLYIHAGRHVCDCFSEERTANYHKPAHNIRVAPSNLDSMFRIFQAYKARADNAFVSGLNPKTWVHTITDKLLFLKGTRKGKEIDISVCVPSIIFNKPS